MDYSACVSVKFLLTGRYYEAGLCAILLPLRCTFGCHSFLLKSKLSISGRKPWSMAMGFEQNRDNFCDPFTPRWTVL